VGVTVNSQTLEDRQIEQEMARLRPEYEQAFADMESVAREAQLRDWATENLIERTLVAQAAARCDIEVSDDEVDQILSEWKKACEDPGRILEDLQCRDEDEVRQRIRQNQKASRLMARAGRTAPKPTAEQVEQYYQDHKDQFVQAQQVRVSHIVKYVNAQCTEQQAELAIRQAQAELDRGMPFEWVAGRYSDDPERGGHLGAIGPGEVAGEFEDILFNLGPGQTSGVFRTRYGFHIAKVHERIPPKTLALAQVRGHIEGVLSQELSSEAMYAFIDSLRAKARIERS
jgi:peptidyl-prolyl cis-trans isomerase SurA